MEKLRNSVKGFIVVAAAVLMLSPLLGVGQAAAASRNAISIGMWSSPGASMLPHFYQVGYARAVYRILFRTLLQYDDDFNIVPNIAASYSISDDGKTYCFKIRDDAIWHDGKPVTSRDVKFTAECLSDPDFAFYGYQFVAGILGAKERRDGKTKDLAGFKIIDDKTFEVTTDGVFAPMLDGFGTELHIIPHHILKDIPVKDMAQSKFAFNPTVGCGPYQFVKYVTDQYVELKCFDRFYLGRPKIETVFIRIVIPDVAVAQLQKGELDMVFGGGLGDIPNIEIPVLRKNPSLVLKTAPGPYTQLMLVNCKQEKFKDLRVRRAMIHAINREGIQKKILFGNGMLGPGALNPGFPYHNNSLHPHEYNPEEARQLLKEAGWHKDTPVRLLVPTGNKERIQWATVAQQNFREVGIKADLQQFDISTAISMWRKTPEKVDGFFVGLINYLDPYTYFQRRFHSKESGTSNLSFYSNPEVDELIDKSVLTVDRAERKKYYDRIQEILYDELPVVPIIFPASTIAVNKWVHGVKYNILPVTRNIHEWTVD